MPRYIFHVGPHKTGSTYLQNMCFAHQRALLEQGVLYPLQWRGPHTGHHLLADLIRKKQIDALTSEFAKCADHEGVVLISSENLADLAAEDWALIRNITTGSPISFVFFCRRWSELLPSCWQEEVKQGSCETFPEFYAPRIADPFSNNVINYAITLDKLSKAFDRSDIALVSFNNLIDYGNDLFLFFIESVLKIAKPRGYSPNLAPHANESLDIRQVELLRVLNSLKKAATGSSAPRILDRYLLMSSNLRLARLFAAMSEEMGRLVLNDDSAALGRLFDDITSRYGANLLNREDGARLFKKTAARHFQYVKTSYLLKAGMVDELMALYNTLELS